MESSECESADDTDAEQLTTVHCTSTQQSGGGSTPATAKADRLAAECLWKKCHRAEETTEERAARQQSYMPSLMAAPCATAAPACVRCGHISYISINIYLAKSRIRCDR